MTNGVGEFANLFAVQGGSVGILTRFERESLLNTRMADGTEWGIDTLPMLNFPIGTYFYESKGDYNTIAGAATADLTRARKEHYGFAVGFYHSLLLCSRIDRYADHEVCNLV